MVPFEVTFCLSKLFTFSPKKKFQSRVCCCYFRFQKWFYVVVLDFQIELWCKCFFGNQGLENCFGYFFQNLGNFSNLLVTLAPFQVQYLRVCPVSCRHQPFLQTLAFPVDIIPTASNRDRQYFLHRHKRIYRLLIIKGCLLCHG